MNSETSTKQSKASLNHSLSHSSFLMEHSSSTSARYLTLFWAVCFSFSHMSCLPFNSAILVRLQVNWFASLALPLWTPFSVWTIQPKALCVISCTDRCSACLCLQGSFITQENDFYMPCVPMCNPWFGNAVVYYNQQFILELLYPT